MLSQLLQDRNSYGIFLGISLLDSHWKLSTVLFGAVNNSSGEAAKLQQHLDLLREQYVKLQQRYAELEQKYTRAIATSGNVNADHFINRLLKLVSDLYDKPLYR